MSGSLNGKTEKAHIPSIGVCSPHGDISNHGSISPLKCSPSTEKDFIGFAVLSTPLFPLKGKVSNLKGILMKKLAAVLLALAVCAGGMYSGVRPAEAKTTGAAEARAQKDLETARSRLDAFMSKHVERCNLAVRPCKTQPSISKRN